MKKLMTMIAAVATAFGLYAADSHYYATSFEAGVDTGCTTEPLAFNLETAGWTAGTTTEKSFDLGTYESGEGYNYAGNTGTRRTFTSPLNNNYLKLETGSSTVGVWLDATDIFIDQTVKFTGFEEVPAADAIDGQIAIWASAIEADDTADPAIVGDTNLYARVGTGNGYADVKIAIDDFDPTKWYRLTIKSIGNVLVPGAKSQAGFLVYINGLPATTSEKYSTFADNFTDAAKGYYEKGQLFTGIKTDSAAFTTVAFQGIGSIDDFVTSVEAPDFAAEVEFSVAAITGATIDQVVAMDGETEVPLKAPYAVMPGTTVKVYFKPAGGYRLDAAVATTVINEAGVIDVSGQITVVEGYATLNGAIKGEAELAAMMAGLKDGDEVAFIKEGSVTNSEEVSFYTFTTNTQIAVANGAWTLTIGNVDDQGNAGTFGIYTDIANDITVVFAAGDTLSLGDGITIAAGKTLDASDANGSCVAEGVITVAGTLKGVNTDGFSDGSITLDGAGSVWSKTKLAGSIFTNEKVAEAGDAQSGYTYTIMAEPTTFDITITTPENGTLETSITNGVVAGTTVTVTATPVSGYELQAITVDGQALAEGVYTFSMPAANVTVAATFKAVTPVYNITITTPVNGTLETSITNGVVEGTSVMVTATPASGYVLEQITVDGEALAKGVNTFSMPAKNVTVAATFKKAVVDPSSSIEVSAGSADAACEKIQIVAPAAAGTLTAEQLAAYQAYFTKSAIEKSQGVWEVSISLTSEAQAQLAEKAKITAVASGDQVTLTPTEIVPGFFYGVAKNTALQSLKTTAPAKWTIATTTGLAEGALTVSKTPAATQEFFVIKVSATPAQ